MNITIKIGILGFNLMALLLINSVYAQEPSSKSHLNNTQYGIYLEGYAYPYPVSFLTLNTQGQQLKMAYMYIKANKPNGQSILLLHGKNFNGMYFKQVIAHLRQAGFNVLVPDQIGFGKSSKPTHYQYSFQQLAQHTKSLLDELSIKKTLLLGHSIGGMLATRFALMYPDTTTKLILESPVGLEDWKLNVPYPKGGVDFWYQSELAKTSEKIKQYQLTHYYNNQWKPEYQPYVDVIAGFISSPDYPRYAWNSALIYEMMFTQPVVYEFKNLTMPTLLIIGKKDTTALGKNWVTPDIAKTMGNYPALGKKAAALIPDATLIELENVGHLPHIQAFDRFMTPLMAFLQPQ
ncbi:alpha/beta fold hydrolase [Shewanella surugensis]|uniref:Alpha/beta hydrolase n=1 Tax=Shewanella surugensis TaxID=212020 RepID=A0ABT0LKZ9_9GAMM|nr:alpha/beta hydrolase [Shewanella surugensis]MCL1127977.1 alpha/beta hydrolase [Shewanella surugensis]